MEKIMNRLTIKQENEYEFIDDILYGPFAEELLIKMGQLEDEEEQRQKGCEWCQEWGSVNNRNYMVLDDAGDSKTANNNNLVSRKSNYCPICGKKFIK